MSSVGLHRTRLQIIIRTPVRCGMNPMNRFILCHSTVYFMSNTLFCEKYLCPQQSIESIGTNPTSKNSQRIWPLFGQSELYFALLSEYSWSASLPLIGAVVSGKLIASVSRPAPDRRLASLEPGIGLPIPVGLGVGPFLRLSLYNKYIVPNIYIRNETPH
jgi:hypothetical protein